MSNNSPSKLGAERTKGADRQPPKRTFKERILHNFREFVAMFLYLWFLFALSPTMRQSFWLSTISITNRSVSRSLMPLSWRR
jgi:hypothetical protein